MHSPSVWLLCSVPLLLAAEAPPDPQTQGPAELQGTWKLVSIERDGKDQDFPVTLPRWTIKGTKVYTAGEEFVTLKVDSSTKPKCFDLDFIGPKGMFEGIYVVEGDKLKVCINRAEADPKERPQEFKTEGKASYRLLTFRRLGEKEIKEPDDASGFLGLMLRFDEEQGRVVIVDIIAGCPASKVGLKKDDMILKVGDKEPKTLREAIDAVLMSKPGTELPLKIGRDKKEIEVKVRVGVVPIQFYIQ